jgi:ABC-type multidrug transport system fused ATPase/permease subunit
VIFSSIHPHNNMHHSFIHDSIFLSFGDTHYRVVRLLRYRDQELKMSDVRRTQTSGPNQSQADLVSNMLVVSELGVRSRNKIILKEISFKVKKGTSLAIVGPNGGGKPTLFKALLNLIPYTGMIRRIFLEQGNSHSTERWT